MQGSDIFLGFIAILFPPIAVWVKSGICSVDSIINIALCCLGFFPGLIHAWYIIARNPDEDFSQEALNEYRTVPQDLEHGEGPGGRPRTGSVTFYYVGHRTSSPNHMASSAPKPQRGELVGDAHPPPQRGYGTAGPAPGVGASSAGEGDSQGGVPPSYAEAVKGDNKVQTNE
ncbi:MAG: hypothetical protein M4579_003548 [Chaenotheca gracillima]|nr:MAG: hypothetical protein M4579_003548 [Chaenotheca gracillima]